MNLNRLWSIALISQHVVVISISICISTTTATTINYKKSIFFWICVVYFRIHVELQPHVEKFFKMISVTNWSLLSPLIFTKYNTVSRNCSIILVNNWISEYFGAFNIFIQMTQHSQHDICTKLRAILLGIFLMSFHHAMLLRTHIHTPNASTAVTFWMLKINRR